MINYVRKMLTIANITQLRHCKLPFSQQPLHEGAEHVINI